MVCLMLHHQKWNAIKMGWWRNDFTYTFLIKSVQVMSVVGTQSCHRNFQETLVFYNTQLCLEYINLFWTYKHHKPELFQAPSLVAQISRIEVSLPSNYSQINVGLAIMRFQFNQNQLIMRSLTFQFLSPVQQYCRIIRAVPHV